MEASIRGATLGVHVYLLTACGLVRQSAAPQLALRWPDLADGVVTVPFARLHHTQLAPRISAAACRAGRKLRNSITFWRGDLVPFRLNQIVAIPPLCAPTMSRFNESPTMTAR